MQTMLKTVFRACGAALAFLIAFLGGMDAPLSVLLALMALDLVTGLAAAAHGKSPHTEGGRFLSRAMFLGLTRKMTVLMMVGLSHLLDALLNTPNGLTRAAVIGFYAANEGLSAVENAALLGVPFPGAVLNMLEGMREKAEAAREEKEAKEAKEEKKA